MLWCKTTTPSVTRLTYTRNLTDAEIISVLDYVDSMPATSNYYAHRKMSDKELKAQLEYIDTYPGGNFGQNEHILDSLQKL